MLFPTHCISPGHDDHKERNYGTTTFAAPVTLDDAVVNMAVVVKNTGKHHYKLHRVINSDGTSITGNKKREPGILSLTNSGQRLSAEFSNGIIKSNKKKSNEDSNKKQNFALRAPVEEAKDLIAVILYAISFPLYKSLGVFHLPLGFKLWRYVICERFILDELQEL
jgi:hypothetical protein